MPGKVNPVIAEALIQVGAQVIGNDAAIGTGAMLGHFQLNTMQPLIARNLLEQIKLLTNGATVFTDKMVVGLEPQREKITANVEQSLGLATALVPYIGYDRAAEIAKQAEAEGKTIRQVAKEQRVISDDNLARAMAAYRADSDGHNDAS
jgi:fumarate hydratase class II